MGKKPWIVSALNDDVNPSIIMDFSPSLSVIIEYHISTTFNEIKKTACWPNGKASDFGAPKTLKTSDFGLLKALKITGSIPV